MPCKRGQSRHFDRGELEGNMPIKKDMPGKEYLDTAGTLRRIAHMTDQRIVDRLEMLA
jgi:hypothetical protein